MKNTNYYAFAPDVKKFRIRNDSLENKKINVSELKTTLLISRD